MSAKYIAITTYTKTGERSPADSYLPLVTE